MDKRPALREQAQRLNVSIVKRVPILSPVLHGASPRRDHQNLARDMTLLPRQPALLYALRHIRKKYDCSLQPSTGYRRGAPSSVVKREMECHKRRATHIISLDKRAIRTFASIDALLQETRPKRSFRQPFQIARPQSADNIRLPEQRQRLRPITGLDRSPSNNNEFAPLCPTILPSEPPAQPTAGLAERR